MASWSIDQNGNVRKGWMLKSLLKIVHGCRRRSDVSITTLIRENIFLQLDINFRWLRKLDLLFIKELKLPLISSTIIGNGLEFFHSGSFLPDFVNPSFIFKISPRSWANCQISVTLTKSFSVSICTIFGPSNGCEIVAWDSEKSCRCLHISVLIWAIWIRRHVFENSL